MFCPGCANPVDPEVIFCSRCGFSVRRAADPVRYASFLRRVGATFIDLALMIPVIMLMVSLFMRPPTDEEMQLARRMKAQEIHSEAQADWMQFRLQQRIGGLMLITFLVGWPYFTLLEASPMQGTLGKMICGMKVTDLDGRRIRWGRANGRYFGRWLSGLPSCIGFLMPIFTEKKQALHDLLAGCLVLRK